MEQIKTKINTNSENEISLPIKNITLPIILPMTPLITAPLPKENPNFERSAGMILFREREEKEKLKEKKSKKKNKRNDELPTQKIREYLLLKYSFKNIFWSFCKGLIENGETEEQTALREAKEESALKKIELLPGFKEKTSFFKTKEGRQIYKEVAWFIGFVSDKTKGKVSWEHAELGWFTFADAAKTLTFPKEKELLAKAEWYLNSEEGQLLLSKFCPIQPLDLGRDPKKLKKKIVKKIKVKSKTKLYLKKKLKRKR
ncbi:NUDIX domain-containing protein [Candidatus Woesearchaeota archaeon]|nr:NUDIX domain-containing protein [Candidatus Woesearchaeota archaeon]